jgi:plastocyanin
MNRRSLRGAVFFAVALAMHEASAGAVGGAAAGTPATHTVAIAGAAFQQAALTVKVGDSVIWINKDSFPHTVTSVAGGFDSHEIAAGRSWKYTAAKKGDFPYVCTLHPTMKATLHVE